jgi:integrase
LFYNGNSEASRIHKPYVTDVRVGAFQVKNSHSREVLHVEESPQPASRESLRETIETREIRGKILEYQLYLQRKGRKPLTIAQVGKRLIKHVSNGVNLSDPEAFKNQLARKEHWSNRTKLIEVSIYDGFLRFLKTPWEKPEYRIEKKATFIPTEQEIDELSAAVGKKLTTFLHILKETALRAGECALLQWTDIDFQRKLISVKTEKGSDPRIIPISTELVEMLSIMPRKSERVFPATKGAISSNYYQQRKKIARKLGNPRLLKIGFHTFRHWKLTTYAHEVRDPFMVQDFAGHKDMKSTMLYIHLEKQIYRNGRSEDYHVAAAKTVEEASSLIAVGYEFVHEYNGVMIYRKRK